MPLDSKSLVRPLFFAVSQLKGSGPAAHVDQHLHRATRFGKHPSTARPLKLAGKLFWISFLKCSNSLTIDARDPLRRSCQATEVSLGWR